LVSRRAGPEMLRHRSRPALDGTDSGASKQKVIVSGKVIHSPIFLNNCDLLYLTDRLKFYYGR